MQKIKIKATHAFIITNDLYANRINKILKIIWFNACPNTRIEH